MFVTLLLADNECESMDADADADTDAKTGTIMSMMLGSASGSGGGVNGSVLTNIIPLLLLLLLCLSGAVLLHRQQQRTKYPPPKTQPLASHANPTTNKTWSSSNNDTTANGGRDSSTEPHMFVSASTSTSTASQQLPTTSTNTNNITITTTFIVWTDPDWRVLDKAVQEYRAESVRALHTLSRNLEHVLVSEELRERERSKKHEHKKQGPGSSHYLLSDSLQQRLNRLADIYEADAVTLQDVILQPHAYTKVLLPPPSPATDTPSNNNISEQIPSWVYDYSETGTNRDTTDTTTTAADTDTDTTTTGTNHRKPPPSLSTIFGTATTGATAGASDAGSAAYSQAKQILAHLARDWSTAGYSVRQTLYPWCQDRLHRYDSLSSSDANTDNVENNANSDSNHHNRTTVHRNRSVLVPGAGLGRLAWELAQDGWTIHALEASPVMAAAAASMLHWSPTSTSSNNNDDDDDDDDDDASHTRSTIRIHPFSMDYFANEVDAVDRYESVTVPDVHPGLAMRGPQRPSQGQGQRQPVDKEQDNNNNNNNSHNISSRAVGSLSYTIGHFGSDYSKPPTTSSTVEQPYAAIVTCFFLDTATNVYDYLDIMASSIATGGLWINVGPLQWHGNAVISMTATDLRSVLTDYYEGCWDILEWSVDSEPVPYRTSDDRDRSSGPRSTNYDGFRPLRFVARKL